jgi:hypothetical protein
MDIDGYVEQVLDEHRLDDELIRIEHLLLGLTKQPHPDKAIQARKVYLMTQIFKALLSAKEARQKCIQQIREDNRRCTENRCASPADNTPRRVGVWNILKQKVAGR